MSTRPKRIVQQPRRMLVELRRDVDRYRDALVKLVVTCEQSAQPMPQGLVGFVKPQQFAEGQAQMLSAAVKEARAVMVAPSWVARMCEPESTPQPAPEPRP